jgi:hypothetical protein
MPGTNPIPTKGTIIATRAKLGILWAIFIVVKTT